MKPFGPMDHMGPQLIIKEEVQEDVIPPPMVCSRLIFPLLADPMEGILGNLSNTPLSVSSIRNKEGGYLMCCQVMSPPRCQGMNSVVKMFDLTQKTTRG